MEVIAPRLREVAKMEIQHKIKINMRIVNGSIRMELWMMVILEKIIVIVINTHRNNYNHLPPNEITTTKSNSHTHQLPIIFSQTINNSLNSK
jgi:hypothetical protein